MIAHRTFAAVRRRCQVVKVTDILADSRGSRIPRGGAMFFRSTVYTDPRQRRLAAATEAQGDNQALANREFFRIADLFLVRVERLDCPRRYRRCLRNWRRRQ